MGFSSDSGIPGYSTDITTKETATFLLWQRAPGIDIRTCHVADCNLNLFRQNKNVTLTFLHFQTSVTCGVKNNNHVALSVNMRSKDYETSSVKDESVRVIHSHVVYKI